MLTEKWVAQVLWLALLLCGRCSAEDGTARTHFEKHVRPLFIKKCWGCHLAEAEGGLRLDSREHLLRGGDRGAAVVSGRPAASLLLAVVSGRHRELQMPPDEPLTATEVEHLRRWIAFGAPWPDDENGSSSADNHWAFSWDHTATIDPPPGTSHAVDAFLAQAHESRGLRAAPLADRRTILRRLSYDLIGLPPTMSAVEQFEADRRPDAYERVVERLLASPQYGERWGRHWLDLVRYADTAGDAADFPIPEAYKYRNYVIDAFNRDLPYDQFVREQLAGDCLAAPSEAEHWRQTVATGYLAIARRVGVSPHQQRHILLEDVLDNLGKTFLGLTIGCARCHDHKFDPISAADYYALYGIFDSTVFPHAGAEHKPYREHFVYRIGQESADALLAPHRQRVAPVSRLERVRFEEYRALQRQDITKAEKTRAELWTEVLELRAQRGAIGATFPVLETAYAVREGVGHDAQIQQAGDPRQLGEPVPRGFLQVLGGQKLSVDSPGSGRLELADWIASRENPLTARVMVNRVWHHHFGRGLVASTSDFGVRGDVPTHPQLLDYLAQWFVRHHWSMKALHRLLVTSQAYRRSSLVVTSSHALDPDNVWWWRAARRRLDAEQFRDTLLLLGAELDESPGKAHPFPHPFTYFYRQHEPFQEVYANHRRSVYQLQPRLRKDPFVDLFDGPDGNLQFAERRSSITALQALYLMNATEMQARAESIARRATAIEGQQQRLDWLYQTLLQRHLRPSEQRKAAEYFARRGDRPTAWAGLVRVLIASNEFMFVD